jgi:hypothetical protein
VLVFCKCAAGTVYLGRSWAKSLSGGMVAFLHIGTPTLQCHVIPHAVIKPIYGAASIGVVKVEDMEGLKLTYRRVAKEMAGARIVDGAMQAGAADDDETDQARMPGRARSLLQ